jgi:hypothetical protein
MEIADSVTGWAAQQVNNIDPFNIDSFEMFIVFLGIILFIYLLLYIYTSIAYMKIAKKLGTERAWLAWIPVGNLLLLSQMAQMHWWPILLIIPVIALFSFMMIVASEIIFIAFFVVSIIGIIILYVHWFIWHWKMYERLGRPGWWSLMYLIPYAGIILYSVLLGIAAFGNSEKAVPETNQEIPKLSRKTTYHLIALGIIIIIAGIGFVFFIGSMFFSHDIIGSQRNASIVIDNLYTNLNSDDYHRAIVLFHPNYFDNITREETIDYLKEVKTRLGDVTDYKMTGSMMHFAPDWHEATASFTFNVERTKYSSIEHFIVKRDNNNSPFLILDYSIQSKGMKI